MELTGLATQAGSSSSDDEQEEESEESAAVQREFEATSSTIAEQLQATTIADEKPRAAEGTVACTWEAQCAELCAFYARVGVPKTAQAVEALLRKRAGGVAVGGQGGAALGGEAWGRLGAALAVKYGTCPLPLAGQQHADG